jgi:hypothetical protein
MIGVHDMSLWTVAVTAADVSIMKVQKGPLMAGDAHGTICAR